MPCPAFIALQLPFDQHVMAPLAGLKISLTGATEQGQRNAFGQQITYAGAEHSADLMKDCTHLIAFTCVGSKHK